MSSRRRMAVKKKKTSKDRLVHSAVVEHTGQMSENMIFWPFLNNRSSFRFGLKRASLSNLFKSILKSSAKNRPQNAITNDYTFR